MRLLRLLAKIQIVQLISRSSSCNVSKASMAQCHFAMMAAMQAPKGAQCIPRLIGFGPKILAPSWPADPNGILHEHIVVLRAPFQVSQK